MADVDQKAKAEAEAKAKAEKEAAAKKAAADKAKAEKAEAGKKFFKSVEYAGLSVLKEDGSTVRFTPYFDTFKGDTVRVGFLETEDKEVVDRLVSLGGGVTEVDEKEYKEAAKKLERAPAYSA
jgi:hypothetical protein